MGLFTHVCGNFKCVRCGNETADCIQTKLFRVTVENHSKEYRGGDLIIIDGLDNYCPVYPWKAGELLRVVMGDWGCGICHLNWQWAVVAFQPMDIKDNLLLPFSAKIETIDTFVPTSAERFDGINFIESDLAELAISLQQPSDDGKSPFADMAVDKRIATIVAGHRRWLENIRHQG